MKRCEELFLAIGGLESARLAKTEETPRSVKRPKSRLVLIAAVIALAALLVGCAVQEDPRIEGLLVLLNTVGGDVEAGLALAELIASVSKPSATLVLGGGHSIGIPLAVSAQRSFIVPTATMTVHPVRHSGVILGVPQTMHWFDQMQQRITGFVAAHSGMTEKRYTELMLHTGELVMDMGTVLDGRRAVKEKLIDELGGLSDALDWLHRAIETRE